MGRKGPFVFHEAADTPGVEPFSVWHQPDGKEVYGDAMAASGRVEGWFCLLGQVDEGRPFYA